ncbi:TonB-dependent receptor [Snuella lapsa]|uniref:TonB-dependent receptor n=2 Tax=Snuella lapsa TaxID=870481 RepID=A0ABP6X5P5_9FLAO
MQSIWAQQIIKGTVTDVNKVPLPGASVLIKGTTTGSQTDFDGVFSLQASTNDVLVVSYLGYITQEVTVTSSVNYTVILQEDLNQLDEVVVVGYGTQKKAVLTSSVSSVKGADLAKEPILNATQALQGKAAGVQVIASDAPGQASTIIIRGLGTVGGSSDPLYVVDGILTGNINNLNTSDIQTMSVLKDAAAKAIYGNRGANGVIIITTKRGKEGKMQISFDAYTGVRDVLSRVKMANASEYVIYSNEGRLRDLRRDDDPNNDNDTGSFFPTNQLYDTNWLDEITRLGRVSNYNLSLSGGSEKIKAFFSAGLNDEEGILKGNDFRRFTLRSNIDYEISEKLSLSQTASIQLANVTPKIYGAFTTAYKQAPIVPVYDEQGRFGSAAAFNNVGNPVKDLFFQNEKQRFFKVQGSLKLDYKIIEPLTFTSQFSIESEYGRFYSFTDILGSFLAGNPANTEADYFRENPDRERTAASVTHTNHYNWFIDNYVTFNKTFQEAHTIKATFGASAQESRGESLTGYRVNVPLDANLNYILNAGDVDDRQAASGSLGVKDRLYSYFARASYDYKNKYLVSGSYRRDGSSKFQEGNRIGDFFAVSVGWVVTEENFMKNSAFDILKLRASYGEVGNQNVPLQQIVQTTGSGGFYAFGPNQALQQGTTIASTISPDLTWETTEEYNIGAEFTLFDYKLSGEVDFYRKETPDAIVPVALPDVFGLGGFDDHIGSVLNKGVEASLNWKDKIGEKFNYSFGVNFAYNENELAEVKSIFFNESIGGGINNGQYTKRVREGYPLGSFYLYDVIGIDDKGEFVYDDVNNNGLIDEDDRKFMGSFLPKYTLGFNFGIEYNNFDFTVDTYTSLGAKVYNGKKAQRFSNENIEQSVFNNRWTSGRPSNTTPIAFNEVPLSSDYYLESADFFRINNITLGYTLPDSISSFFSSVRIYATAKNPIIFKEFSGFTPELPGSPLGNAGIELDAYPTLKSFHIGINTSF